MTDRNRRFLWEPDDITVVGAEAPEPTRVTEYNHTHDEKGRFASATGPGYAEFPEAQATALAAAESETRGNDFETVTAIDPQGRMVMRAEGEKDQVAVGVEEQMAMNGAVVTHNHPGGTTYGDETVPLSPDDIEAASFNGATAIRAVSKNGTVTQMRPGPNGWGNTLAAAAATQAAHEKVRAELLPKVRSGELTIQKGNSLAYDMQNRMVADAMGWKYEVFDGAVPGA